MVSPSIDNQAVYLPIRRRPTHMNMLLFHQFLQMKSPAAMRDLWAHIQKHNQNHNLPSDCAKKRGNKSNQIITSFGWHRLQSARYWHRVIFLHMNKHKILPSKIFVNLLKKRAKIWILLQNVRINRNKDDMIAQWI